MALPRQVVKIPLGGGVDTKSDVKQVAIGKLTLLENAVFTSPQQLQKRFGMSPFVTSVISGAGISAGKFVAALNNELLMGDGSSFYSYSPGSVGWAKRGALPGAHVSTSSVFQDGNDHNAVDCATANGLVCYAWSVNGPHNGYDGGISAAVFDVATSQAVVAVTLMNAGGDNPHCSVANGKFFVHYAVAGAIKVRSISATAPTTFSAEVSCVTDLDAGNNSTGLFHQVFDISKSGASLVLAYRSSVPGLKAGFLDSNGVLAVSPTPVTSTDVPGIVSIISYSNSDATNDGVYVVYQTTGGDIRCLIYNLALSNAPTPVVIRTNDNTVFGSITLCQPGPTYVRMYFSWIAAGTGLAVPQNYISCAAIQRNGTVTPEAAYQNSVAAVSKPVVINGVVYMLACFPDAVQSSYFLLSGEVLPNVVARISPSGGALGLLPAGVPILWSLANIGVTASGGLIIPCMIRTDLPSDGTQIFANFGIQAALIDFNDQNLWKWAQIGSSIFICAGMLWQYDGANLCEVGFNNYPNVSALYTPGTPGSLTIGTRSYIVLYEWTNQYGAIERSNFDSAHLVTSAANSTSNTLSIPYLQNTTKQNVKIGIYRTIDAGTTFYKIGEVANQPTTKAPFSYVDTTADVPLVADGSFVVGNTYTITTVGTTTWTTVGVPSNVTPAIGVEFTAIASSGGGTGVASGNGTGISANELLYTTGGVFANDPPPSVASVAEYLDRMILVGLEDGDNTQFSKSYDPTKVLSFSNSFYNRVDTGRLGVTAVGSLDEKLIFFKPNEMFLTAGRGPLDTGAQNDFLTPEIISSDVGCKYPKSVVKFPMGLIFKSAKGWYLLDRSLQVQYIGAAVEAFNGLTVTSAVLLDGVNQIRFTHSDGSGLVYDYAMSQWSTFTGYQFTGAAMWQGAYVAVSAAGVVSQESTTSHLDNGVAVETRAITPWIAMNTMAGFQRIYSIVFLGEKKSNHTFNVKVYYDYEISVSETFTIDMSTISDSIQQLSIRPARQKCEAIKLEIFDTNPGNIEGAGVSFSALSVEIGVKQGVNKLPTTSKMVGS